MPSTEAVKCGTIKVASNVECPPRGDRTGPTEGICLDDDFKYTTKFLTGESNSDHLSCPCFDSIL